MTERRTLPARRTCETIAVEHRGRNYLVTVGHYEDGSAGEVFVAGTKAGADMDGVCRDAAVLLSIAMQHRVPLSVMAGAITRNPDGSPSTVIGAILDLLSRHGD